MHEKIDSLCDSTLEFSLLWSTFYEIQLFYKCTQNFYKTICICDGGTELIAFVSDSSINIYRNQGPDLKFYPSKP